MKQLETDRLILRSLNEGDAKIIEELAGEYDVAKTTLNIPHPYPKGSAKVFIERSLRAEKSGEVYTYAIIDQVSNLFLGIIGIHLDKAHDRAELGYWIGKPYWGKGYGTEAARAMLSFGFEILDVNKIYATAMTNNPGSWRIMEKIGMTHEGTLKQHTVRSKQYADVVYYGMLKEDYETMISISLLGKGNVIETIVGDMMIRTATFKDVEGLTVLMGELGYPTTTPAMEKRFNKIHSNASYHTLIAERDGVALGMVGMFLGNSFEKDEDYVRIIALVVHSKYRNEGIGKALIHGAERWAIKQGVRKLALNSGNRSERGAAHGFYKRQGFEGKATGFYKDLVESESMS